MNHSTNNAFDNLLEYDRRERGRKHMSTTTFRPATQKSGRLYAMVGFRVILLAFVAVTFFLLTRDGRNEQEWIRLVTHATFGALPITQLDE
jgi:hypothetical protein